MVMVLHCTSALGEALLSWVRRCRLNRCRKCFSKLHTDQVYSQLCTCLTYIGLILLGVEIVSSYGTNMWTSIGGKNG